MTSLMTMSMYGSKEAIMKAQAEKIEDLEKQLRETQAELHRLIILLKGDTAHAPD